MYTTWLFCQFKITILCMVADKITEKKFQLQLGWRIFSDTQETFMKKWLALSWKHYNLQVCSLIFNYYLIFKLGPASVGQQWCFIYYPLGVLLPQRSICHDVLSTSDLQVVWLFLRPFLCKHLYRKCQIRQQ